MLNNQWHNKARSNRYNAYIKSKKWRRKSDRYLSISNCCLFPWLKATHAHHLSYDNLEKETFWFDVLPLSRFAHKPIIHHWILWNSGHPDWWPRIITNYYLRFIGFPIAFLAKLLSKSKRKSP